MGRSYFKDGKLVIEQSPGDTEQALPTRIDKDGRDVTDLPGLWSNEDTDSHASKDSASAYSRSVDVIRVALSECSNPSLKAEDHKGNAVAILARLAKKGLLCVDATELGEVEELKGLIRNLTLYAERYAEGIESEQYRQGFMSMVEMAKEVTKENDNG